jgi:site-specific DNA recombinase
MIEPKKFSNLEYIDLINKVSIKGNVFDGNFSKIKNVYGYCRVSSDEQKKGYSIQGQKDTIDGFCKANGLILKSIFIDEGFSAKSSRRPDFEALMKVVEPDSIILVLWWSRFYRNFISRRFLTNFLSNKNIWVYAIESNNDPFMADIEGLLDENELIRLGKRVKDIMVKKFDNFKNKQMSRPPFGYASVFKKTQKLEDKGKWTIDKREAEIVQQIFSRVSEGYKICNLKREFNISYNSINNMLRNKTYLGMRCFDGVWQEQKSLKLIDQELFDKVQRTLK